jgi:hypothetical protein
MKRKALWMTALAVAMTLATAHADEVTDWNQTAFRYALQAGTNPVATSRLGAAVHGAMFDAANGIERRYEPVHVTPAGPPNASVRAAVVEAAYTVLVGLPPLPTAPQKGILDSRRAVALEIIRSRESGTAVDSGIAWGHTVAVEILAWRAMDGIGDVLPDYLGGPGPGAWRPTPPGFLPGFGLQYADMVPWVIGFAGRFHPPGPPALGSARYTADFNETKSMGSATSMTRTRDQTVFSYFWNSSTAPAIWNSVAVDLLEREGRDDDDHHHHGGSSLLSNARFLALLNMGMADAAIGCWEAKYSYSFWRPVAAIREADTDGNPQTDPDATWTPLLVTPAHPDYPSGHSCVSGAAGAILADRFGERTHFTIETDLMLGVERDYRSFSAALEEVKNARIFGGIHFRTACDDGQTLGRSVAAYVLDNALPRDH